MTCLVETPEPGRGRGRRAASSRSPTVDRPEAEPHDDLNRGSGSAGHAPDPCAGPAGTERLRGRPLVRQHPEVHPYRQPPGRFPDGRTAVAGYQVPWWGEVHAECQSDEVLPAGIKGFRRPEELG